MGTAENKRSVIVGIFVLLGIIIFVVGVFTLANHQKRLMESIRLSAVFDDVAGMRKGNNVWFSGVKIGNVKEIHFYGDSQVEILMDIEASARQYIRKDAKARISSESLIGNKIIEIFGGSQQAPPVEDGDRLTAVNPMNTDDMMATLQENNKNLVDITNNMKKLSADLVQGKGTAGALLTDSTLANNFRSMVASLQQTSANTVQASRSLNRFTRTLNNRDGLVNQMLTDTAVFHQLQSSVVQLQKATATATQITNSLQQASGQLNTTDNTVGILLHDQEFAKTLKSTMQNLETSTEKLDQNMEALQRNFLFRGYFRRQEKEQRKDQKAEE